MATATTSDCSTVTHEDLIEPMRTLGIHDDIDWDELITSDHIDLFEGEFECRPRYGTKQMSITKAKQGTFAERLTLQEYILAAPCLTEEEHREFFLLRKPTVKLAQRWHPTPDNALPELVSYGIPVHVLDIYNVSKEYHEKKQIPFESSQLELRRAVHIINAACHVTHIRAHRVLYAADDRCNWVISLYNNRDMAEWGFPNKEEEDRLTTVIQKLLHLPERPPNLWMWATREEYPIEHGIDRW